MKKDKRFSKAAFHYNQPGTGKSVDWLTPPELMVYLGPFDLDPCASVKQPWKTAKKHYTIKDDGLSKKWRGRVWCNPPYGRKMLTWVERMAEHGNGLLLIFARVDTQAFELIWKKADALLFLPSRISFHTPDGRVSRGRPAASVLVAFGRKNAEKLRSCGLEGAFIRTIKYLGGARIKQERPKRRKKK